MLRHLCIGACTYGAAAIEVGAVDAMLCKSQGDFGIYTDQGPTIQQTFRENKECWDFIRKASDGM